MASNTAYCTVHMRDPGYSVIMVCVCVCGIGMKKFEYMGKQWHEHCFCCEECRQPIGNKSFMPRDQHVICITCYEQQYAQRCTKCDGVSYTMNAQRTFDCT